MFQHFINYCTVVVITVHAGARG